MVDAGVVGAMPSQREQASFADVLLADEEWLRAEFDAIVAANFGSPGDSRRRFRRSPRFPRDNSGRRRLDGRQDRREYGDLTYSSSRAGARQRSPPRDCDR